MTSSPPPLSVVAVPESSQDTATYAVSPMTSETSLPTYTYIGRNVVNMVLTSTDVRNGQPGQLGGVGTFCKQTPITLLAGISSRMSIDGTVHTLKPDTPVRICTRCVQSSISTEKQVRVHFIENVWSTGHESTCSCGNCELRFEVSSELPPKCDCGTDPYDPGQQQCAIM